MKCARCDFDGDLADHAIDAAHPCCICCSRSLTREEPRTCEKCLTRARANLRDIVERYALLPAELANLSSAGWDRPRGSGERALPGGDAMVLLGPGSVGNVRDRRGNRGEDGTTSMPDDAPSVLGVLATHEDDWRHTRGDPAGGPADVGSSAAYLDVQMRWAANEHDAFDEFALDVRQLLQRLSEVTHTSDRVVVAPASCFDCDGRLIRAWTSRGLEDDWHCQRCDRTYSAEAYMLAVRARLQAEQEAS